jgi:hypothetical protein
MAYINRYASGYFFAGLATGASLALSESAIRRSSIGDIRGRATRSPQIGRQGSAAPATITGHGPDKFRQAANYTAEQSVSIRNRPTRATARSIMAQPLPRQTLGRINRQQQLNRIPIIWGEEVTE